MADVIAERLGKHLGPHTGRVAVKTFCQRALGRGPETLEPADLPALEDALRPMLKTLVGKDRAEIVLAQIRQEVGW